MKLSLIIVDNDEIYLSYLNKFLSSTYKGKFEITCFSDEEIFIESINTIRKKDVLIINKDIYDKNEDKIDMNIVLKLVEGNEIIDEESEKIINKYKDVKNIHDIVLKEYINDNPKKTTRIKTEDADTKIITIYSPIGGSGKSTITAAISNQLAKQGKKVFYLNLEDIQSTNMYFDENEKESLSDIIFEVKDRADNFKDKINNAMSTHSTGVMYLTSTSHILDIEDITQEDIKWMLEEILKMKMFNYIIIDTSSKYNGVYDVIINSSDIVITPVINNKSSINKIDKFIKNQSNLDKYYFVQNRNIYNYTMDIQALKYINSKIETSIYEDKNLSEYSEKDVINSSTIKNPINEIIENLGL